MGSLWLDVRYALRMMLRAPGLTAVLVITLALGIGASTTIFSVVNSVVLRPLPYPQPDRLAHVYTEFRDASYTSHALSQFGVSGPEYDDLRRACRSCESMAAWQPGMAPISGGDRPIRVTATYATDTLLPVIGVRPQLGRWFDGNEARGGTRTVIVIGDALWRRAFAADPNIIGREIVVDALPATIVGVMPPGFDFPQRTEAWLPVEPNYAAESRDNHSNHVLVRLAPDATLASFQAELAALTKRWAERTGAVEHHIDPIDHAMKAVSLHANIVGPISTVLWMLQGAVLLVLAIAIVNIAGLLLARSETRTREVAVRHALGASRRRLVRQFVTESLLLGALGGGLGILVAVWGLDGVIALLPRAMPRARELELDNTAVAFAIACAVGAALLFGLAPILHARRTDLHGALKDGSPRMTGSRARLRVRRTLVITEIALAVVLVVACTVIVRSYDRLSRTELGYAPENLLTFEVEIPIAKYPGVAADAFWHRLEDKLRALPGASSATLFAGLPAVHGRFHAKFGIVGRLPDDAHVLDYVMYVGTHAFETLGARLVRGRTILPSDDGDAPLVVVINEAFATKFFPGVDPVGRRLTFGARQSELTIVGVVANIKQTVERPLGTELFLSVWQSSRLSVPPRTQWTMFAVLRAAGDPMDLVPAAYRAVADLDPTLALSHVSTMDDVLWDAGARPRFLAFLLSCFAGLALLLAAVGIYGVMAHSVAQRTHEIGVRVALGARPGQVRAMVLRQAGGLVAIGVAIGVAGTIALQLALDSTLTGLFYGDALTQPLLLGGVAAVVALTALLATWLPVRRATRIEPMTALRNE